MKSIEITANSYEEALKQALDELGLDESQVNAEKVKEQLGKIEISFTVKTGAGDKVFGSVSPKQVADALKEKGFSIDKKQIKEKEALSTLGYHEVEIELHKKVTAKVKVHLMK